MKFLLILLASFSFNSGVLANYAVLKNKATGLLLDTNNQGEVYAQVGNDGDNQKWVIEEKNVSNEEGKMVRIINYATKKCLDSNQLNDKQIDGKVYARECNRGPYQVWKMLKIPRI